MSTFGVKLPDVGEGVAEAELISWCVAVGDRVTTESVLAEVMTDKATVEVASPVDGVVVALHGEPGDVLAVGSELVAIDVEGASPQTAAEPSAPRAVVIVAAEPAADTDRPATSDHPAAPAPPTTAVGGTAVGQRRALAAPAVRSRAATLGIDLATVIGSGPDGRVVHADLDRCLVDGGTRDQQASTSGVAASGEPTLVPIRGLRRRIAEQLSASWAEIPHITYVDAVDLTDLEALRAELNRRAELDRRPEPSGEDQPRLTILPFLARAIVLACAEQPRLNATYDSAAQVLSVFDAVHLGVATQTDDGLMVPVVRHAEARGLRELSAEIVRVSGAARDGRATRHELSGSTITITSLGALGGLVTTPIINRPEVAIVGVNKLETRPVWRSGAFEPRQMMNLSSSFDHRMVDGWDAATFVQRIKSLLEMPALLFVDDDRRQQPTST